MKATRYPFMLAVLAFCALGPVPEGLAQAEPTTSEVVAAKEAAAARDKTLLDKYLDGGPWMHPILLTSLVAVAVSVLCALQIRKGVLMPPDLVRNLNGLMANRQVGEAFQLCKTGNSTLAQVMKAALTKASFERDLYNKGAMEAAAGETLEAEESRLGVWINYLNVCAQLAPMLGLFGTVVGMIESFDSLAAGKSEPSDLAGGIGIAMLTTAGGLIVAIPSMAAYFYFRGQLVSIMTDMQKGVAHMLDLFTGEIDSTGNRAPTGYTGTIAVSSDAGAAPENGA